MRALYAMLLNLHPSAFRERYAPEMMLDFEESGASLAVLIDAAVSLCRQWSTLFSASHLAAATVLAIISPVLISLFIHKPQASAIRTPSTIAAVYLVIASSAAIVISVMTALCVRNFVFLRLDRRPGPRYSLRHSR